MPLLAFSAWLCPTFGLHRLRFSLDIVPLEVHIAAVSTGIRPVHFFYFRTSLIWTSEGWTKSVHISELSTIVQIKIEKCKPVVVMEKCPH